jgi:hypothetical protein
LHDIIADIPEKVLNAYMPGGDYPKRGCNKQKEQYNDDYDDGLFRESAHKLFSFITDEIIIDKTFLFVK